MEVTIFKNIYDRDNPHWRNIDVILERIKNGKSKNLVEQIRSLTDKEKINDMKKRLPTICFSGKFSERNAYSLISHSGYAILDFDDCDVALVKSQLMNDKYIYSCWVSPSGRGVKALVKIPKENHLESYLALIDRFPKTDVACKDVSRACFESYDPDIYINKDSSLFSTKKSLNENVIQIKDYDQDSHSIYVKLKKWLDNKGEYFSEGNRNNFLYKLSCACKRFGIEQADTYEWVSYDFVNGSTSFKMSEFDRTLRSAYENNRIVFGNAKFEDKSGKIMQSDPKDKHQLLEEKDVTDDILDIEAPPRDMYKVEHVRDSMIERFRNGITKGETTNIPDLDKRFRWNKGDLNAFYGIGNHGKTAMVTYLMYLKSKIDGWVWAVYSPENTIEDYFDTIVEMKVSKSTMEGYNKMSEEEYTASLDFVNDHFYFLDPSEEDTPDPDYVLSRFREVISKKRINGVLIDPYNQLVSTQKSFQREDQYLSEIFRTFKLFAKREEVVFNIITHSNSSVHIGADGKIKTPYYLGGIAGGKMWGNKMDNILVYHRPNYMIDSNDPYCELTSQKIKQQKKTGIPGTTAFMYDRDKYRFTTGESDIYADLRYIENE